MIWTTVSILGFAFLIGSINAAAVHPKILGGNNAEIKNFPYLVSIRTYGVHICGGSIISDRHILTAANCVRRFGIYTPPEDVTIHGGTASTTDEGTVYTMLNYQAHPGYIKYDSKNYHDIAIITLKETIEFNKYQKKIKIPNHDVQNHQVVTAAGWGKVSSIDDPYADKLLQKVKLVLLPFDKCQKYVTKELRKEQVCSYRSIGTTPCSGDNGSPLVTNGELVGIITYFENVYCNQDIPTINTNVYRYKDYIDSIVNKPL